MRRILLIDDNLEDRETIRHYFARQSGHENQLWEAVNGEQGLLLAQQIQPDCILLDYNLPDMDGLEIIAELKTQFEQLPAIVMLTGTADEVVAVDALKAGALDYVRKDNYSSFSATSLLLAIDNAVDKYQTQRQLDKRTKQLAISEERLRLVVEASNDGIWDWDIVHNQCYWSERVFEMIALPSDKAGMGLTALVELIAPEYKDYFLTSLHAHLNETQPFYIEFSALRADQSYGYFLCRGKAILNDAGTAIRMIGSLSDINARKLAESELASMQLKLVSTNRELEQANQALTKTIANEQALRVEAEKANQFKDEFLATLSHELRTPLTAISGWAKLLRGGKLTKDVQLRALETIERNAKSQAQLIEDLLDISRIIAGKMRVEKELIEVKPVLDAAINVVRPAAESKSVSLSVTWHNKIPPILADAGRLQQIIWNLLSNAIKFTPKDGRVELNVGIVADEIEIKVTDTGQGIDPVFINHVFERFRQADNSSTRQTTGLGLGLAIVHNLVELHGGKIFAESAGINKGATFIVQLPIAELPLQSEISAADLEIENIDTLLNNTSLREVKVLVVDDEPDNREFIEFVLQQCHAEIVTADSAIAGLELVEKWRPNIIISDISMPGMDGLEFIRQVRARGYKKSGKINYLPAVAITAFVHLEDRVRALSAGFNTHLPKPVNPTELILTITSLL